jgi:hypothetical protein
MNSRRMSGNWVAESCIDRGATRRVGLRESSSKSGAGSRAEATDVVWRGAFEFQVLVQWEWATTRHDVGVGCGQMHVEI